MLMREPELQVATATYAEPTAFLMDVVRIDPDVIVISEACPIDWIQTSDLLHKISLQQIVRVIVARLDDNVLDVYDKQRVKLTCDDDLITLVKKGIVSAVP